jgi:hypothetical protein
MRVRGAAKRHGEEVTIFDQPLDADHMVIGTDGGVEITFLAAGRYDQKSRYRYTVTFSRHEVSALTESLG